jgi:hypothetical protein
MTDYALYIDDSGHPDNQPYVVVAGFVGTEAGWLRFDPAWKDALKRNGLPEPFHMTDFMSQDRSTKERSRILRDLAEVINSHIRARFVGGVDVAAYRRVNEKYALQECLGAPYALASRFLALQMNKWKEKNLKPDERLHLFVEEGTKHRGDMMEVFKRDKLPEPISVKKSLPAVQPADMFAWEMFTFLRDEKNRRRVKRLLGGQTQFGVVVYEKDLIDTCTQSEPRVMLRSELNANTRIMFHSSPKRERKRTIR